MDFIGTGEEKLLEPIKYYKTEFASNFLEKLTSHFEELVKNSNIDIETNRKSVQEYHDLVKSKEKNESILKFLKFISFVSIVSIIVLGIFEYNYISFLRIHPDIGEEYRQIGMRAVLIGLGIIFLIIFNFFYLSKKKKQRNEKIAELSNAIEVKVDECYSQVNDLLRLFKSNIANRIITEVIPTLNLDEYFNIKRYDNLVRNFGMISELGDKISTLDILSGDILGNPFVVVKTLKNDVEDQEYSGSRTVSWTEYYYEDGKRKSRTVTETLTATIVKPKQVFNDSITLIFGSDVAENLNFERQPKFIHHLKPKKLEKYIKGTIKDVQRKTQQAIKKGETFLEMSNLEFDALFGALNRDHEVEFRVLFTPIAQRNMVELLKDEHFGDDFAFYKMKKINEITNNNDWIINISREKYYDFSFDVIKEKYFELNKKYFSNLYKLFLPILSIPVYHQHKTQDYIYETDYRYNYNPYVSEVMANELGDDLFAHRESGTQSILKTTTISKHDDIDMVMVTANSYKTVTRVEYVTKRARNGEYYDVPVEWIEYIPITSQGKMEIKRVDLEENEFENMAYSSENENMKNGKYSFKNNIFAVFNNTDDIKTKEILGGKNGK